jgi:hypothetical protein
VTVQAGSDATFTVQATGSPPLTYQWKKNGVNVPGGTLPTLTLQRVTAEAAGSYTVEVRNSAGSVTSNPVTLTVQAAPIVPRFISIHLKPGNVVELVHEAPAGQTYGIAASPDLKTWTEVHRFTATGGREQFTEVPSGQAERRFYRLESVTVAGKPVITKQPQSQSVLVGQRVTFTVEVSGAPPFTYPWRRNGVNLDGKTGPSLTIASATLGSSGVYTVVVRNALGEVESEPAELAVEP